MRLFSIATIVFALFSPLSFAQAQDGGVVDCHFGPTPTSGAGEFGLTPGGYVEQSPKGCLRASIANSAIDQGWPLDPTAGGIEDTTVKDPAQAAQALTLCLSNWGVIEQSFPTLGFFGATYIGSDRFMEALCYCMERIYSVGPLLCEYLVDGGFNPIEDIPQIQQYLSANAVITMTIEMTRRRKLPDGTYLPYRTLHDVAWVGGDVRRDGTASITFRDPSDPDAPKTVRVEGDRITVEDWPDTNTDGNELYQARVVAVRLVYPENPGTGGQKPKRVEVDE